MNLNKSVAVLLASMFCTTASAQIVSTLVPQFPGNDGISIDPSGNIYVNDRGLVFNGTRVFKVTPSGEFSEYATGLQSYLVGSVFDAALNLYVTGANFGSVSKIAPDGSHTVIATGMPMAGGLEFDSDGNLYCSAFSANFIAKIDPSGTKTVFARDGLMSGPSGLAFDSSTGFLYNANWFDGRIIRYSLDGTSSVFVQLPEASIGPLIIFDNDIYAMAVNGNRIYRISLTDGNISIFAGTGTFGDQDGPVLTAEFRMPVGIGVSPSGNIFYVSDLSPSGSGRLRAITSCPGCTGNCDKDCNGNGVPDTCDISSGTSQDCSGNGIPDECEPDCNGTGLADSCDIFSGASDDCSSNGIPDECEPDCNNTGLADTCDIFAGTSQDCSDNKIPDECEPDCNSTGLADSCDILAGTSLDCNANGKPDSCDLADGSSVDLNNNNIPDDCEPCIPPRPAEAEMIAGALGLVENSKNRFLSFSVPINAPILAIRVTFETLLPPYDIWNGAELWVGPPSDVSQSGGSVTPTPGLPFFKAATLQCDPHYFDWSSLGTVHVFHEGVIPGGNYRVELINEGCALSDASNYSDAIMMTTATMGDTVLDLSTTPPPAADGVVNIVDVLAVLGRFSNLSTAIVKSRADIEPACVDLTINITDVVSSINGFAGLGHPFAPSASDPCNSTCPRVLP